MEIEGRLTIDLNVIAGSVSSVDIGSSRPVGASRLFHGKSVADALQMVPMLFSICGTAQACAGVKACEQAMGIKPDLPVACLRQGLVNMESLREHLWRIFLEWPEFLGEEPQKENMSKALDIQKRFNATMTQKHNPFLHPGETGDIELQIPDELEQQIGELLQHKVLAMPAPEWLEIGDLDELTTWAVSRSTVAARMLDSVIRDGWPDLGKTAMKALPDLESEQLYRVLEDEDFIQKPKWAGECRETSSLTRVETPLLQQLRSLYGNGLLVRLVARLTEIAHLSIHLIPATINVYLSEMGRVNNSGIGQVATARGQLLHRVDLTDGSVSRYQILAPTEWNFHPQGVVAKALKSLKGDNEQIEQQARLLINAVDPCVGYELNINA
jgi:Ni,Fe-hydrogenase I large subunit